MRIPAYLCLPAYREDEAAAQLVSDASFRLRVQAACGLIAAEAAPVAAAAVPTRREGSSECGLACCWELCVDWCRLYERTVVHWLPSPAHADWQPELGCLI